MSANTPIKNHEAERHLFLVRVVTAALITLALACALVARLGYLQILKHDYYSLRSDDNRTRVQVIPPVRGLIYDRNGVVLADNLPAYRLEIVPEQVEDMGDALNRLAEIVEIRPVDRKRFQDRLQENPPFRSIPILLDLSKEEVARFAVNRREFPGMAIHAGLTRHYPLGKSAAHLVGYVSAISLSDLRQLNDRSYRGTSHVGQIGVERSYEAVLHGEPGSRIVEANVFGRPLRQIAINPPTSGRDIYLTIDAELQQSAYRALQGYAGAVVALDPRTGGVLAMVSRPSFKPSLFVNGISQDSYQALLANPRNPLFGRALSGEYPPGSTIKPVMALAGLATNTIEAEQAIWCPSYILLPGSERRWRGWLRRGMGWVDLEKAIYRSSDIYFYKLGMQLGIDTIHRFGTMFGLGHPTGIDLPGEAPGLMPSRSWKHGMRHLPWYPGETLNTVIGQGYVAATPLQLAYMTALIASRGNTPQPHVLKAFGQPGNEQRIPYQPKAGASVTIHNPEYWEHVISGMRKVIQSPHGTAHWYIGRDLTFDMAGKSGTAQVVSIPQGQNAPDLQEMAYQHRPHALFIAFAPASNPRIAVAVVLEHAGGGSSHASPVARKVIETYLKDEGLLDQEGAT